MDQRKSENFIILLVSLACIGLTAESILMKWEFWVPPLIIIGTIFLWVFNLSQKPEREIRKFYYLVYAMLAVFFHGVHDTSFFDVALVVSLVMVAFSFFNQAYMIHLFLAEYVVIMGIQFWLIPKSDYTSFDSLTISRVILHVCIVLLVYFCCVKAAYDHVEIEERDKENKALIESGKADMEDFLSNISHELRTPVNVVNGMSELLIKKKVGSEALAIKDAGIRLANQIEDIQDYTECKREKLILEEESYMSTSLINDVVTAFRVSEDAKNLELVVDLAPTVPTRMKGDIKKLHKIFRHLLENAIKFTKKGGICVKMYSERTDYGVNLVIEMIDTGIGMDRKALESVSEGMYQVNKKRNRSSGGIGLGLFIVYGFAHRMGGFVKIESEKHIGTTVRVTLPQKVMDDAPCLLLSSSFTGNILFHVRSDKYKVPRVRDFYRNMAANLAFGIHAPLYAAETLRDIERLMDKMPVTFIFMGQEEYEDNPKYFDRMAEGETVIAVSAAEGFKVTEGSRVIVMPKPLYGYPVLKILNEGRDAHNLEIRDNNHKVSFDDIRALIVDDEPMNIVVATSLFSDYNMIIDSAGSGKEAILKYKDNDYDVVFMDHMMPEMDGVEAMKHIKGIAQTEGRKTKVVALTANVVSGAREMFIDEGFDGFIAKPINLADFERVMMQVLPKIRKDEGGAKA
ncbi:MAG: response regulator [Lachnospiraceae bacterium]|nr:response regulator [Lachnospiraceae bacterium]